MHLNVTIYDTYLEMKEILDLWTILGKIIFIFTKFSSIWLETYFENNDKTVSFPANLRQLFEINLQKLL